MAVADVPGLDFIALREERYDLVMPGEFFNSALLQILLDVVVNSAFHDELLAFEEHDGSQAGNVVAALRS